MTPFGEKLRHLRQERGVSLKEMAAAIGVSSAYLSALEHGQRSRPNRRFVHQVCQYFGIIWDEAEDLQRLAEISHPKVMLDTSGLRAETTELANLLAARIRELPPETVNRWLGELRGG